MRVNRYSFVNPAPVTPLSTENRENKPSSGPRIQRLSNLEGWKNSVNHKLLQLRLNGSGRESIASALKYQTYKLAKSMMMNSPFLQEARNSLISTSVVYGSTTITNVEIHNGTWTGKVYAGGTEFRLRYSSSDLSEPGTWTIESANGEPYWGEGYLTTNGTLEINSGTITNPSGPAYKGRYSIDLNTGMAKVNLKVGDEDITVSYNPANNRWTLENPIESIGAAAGTPVVLMNNSTLKLTISKEYYDVTYTLTPEGSVASYRFKEDKLDELFGNLGSDISKLTEELGLSPDAVSKILTSVYTFEGDKTGDWIKNIIKEVVGDELTEEQIEEAAKSIYDFTTNAATLKDIYEIFKIAKNGEDFSQLATLGKYAKPLGIVGGALGILAGVESLASGDTVGGMLNMGSGILTIAAVGLAATGVGAPIAATLFMASTALDVASMMWEYRDEITEAAKKVGKSVEEFVSNLMENPAETLGKLSGELAEKINDFKEGIINLKNSIENAFENAVNFFSNAVETAANKLKEYSSNPEAFVRDVANTAVSAANFVKELIEGGLRAVEETFGPKTESGGAINNPSISVNITISNVTENAEKAQGTNTVEENWKFESRIEKLNEEINSRKEAMVNQAAAYVEPYVDKAADKAAKFESETIEKIQNVKRVLHDTAMWFKNESKNAVKQFQTTTMNLIVFNTTPPESALKLFG